MGMARIIYRGEKRKRERQPREYYVPDETRDFHTEFGIIPARILAKGGRYELRGQRFTILPATFRDEYARLKRGAQIITVKDLGFLIAETTLSRESVVLEAGVGSGAATALLARIAKKVYSYDTDERALQRATNNLAALNVPRVYTIRKGDVYDPATIPHGEEIDLFLLDVPDPARALPTARKALKATGWLVAYTPCITQVMSLVEHLGKEWHHVKTCELLERDWTVKQLVVRPVTKDFQHTAFLTFLRKTP